MPTGRTPNLDLALPVQGELTGTWGNEVNNGITDYVDIAIAGTLTLTGDGAVTLANTLGAAAGDNIGSTTAQYAILKIVGPLSATKVITAPSSSKSYIVINTDSTYGVTVKASGQTGVTVAAGTRAAVVFNGTDYVSVSTSAGTGDVVGPASATDGNLAAFDGVTGKLIKQAATVTVAQGGTGASSLTANNVILGNGTSAVQFVAPGTTGNVLTSNGTTWVSSTPAAGATLSANNAFTGANTFYNATGQTFGTATSTQDGIILAGRAGGSSSFRVTMQPGTLSANRTLTLPDANTTVVGTDATQTLTNKTIEAGTFTNGYTEETVTANTGTAYTIDLLNGTVQILTLTGNCTFTFPTATAGRSFILLLKQDGTGGRTVTWPAAVKWPGGTAPTITSTLNKLDKYVFTADGTNWYGSNAGQNYTV